VRLAASETSCRAHVRSAARRGVNYTTSEHRTYARSGRAAASQQASQTVRCSGTRHGALSSARPVWARCEPGGSRAQVAPRRGRTAPTPMTAPARRPRASLRRWASLGNLGAAGAWGASRLRPRAAPREGRWGRRWHSALSPGHRRRRGGAGRTRPEGRGRWGAGHRMCDRGAQEHDGESVVR
jgi:hypothetical protein